VTATLEFGIPKSSKGRGSDSGADYPSPNANYIGVVVCTRCLRSERICDHGCASARHLVGSHGDADTGPADEQSSSSLVLYNCPGNAMTKVWIVNRLAGVGTIIVNLVSELTQKSHEFIL
jgi:hypothetical protein